MTENTLTLSSLENLEQESTTCEMNKSIKKESKKNKKFCKRLNY